jgi:UDP-2,3-diacylglucosamine pyrophosphatase LpxH
MKNTPDFAAEPTPRTPFRLPAPLPEFVAPTGDDAERERTYFDPERWDAEVCNHQEQDERDPVEHDRGKLESTAVAALLVSDFHMADGSAGGDDFLDSHLHCDEELEIETGFFPPGQSRGRLFASVVTFALQRVGMKVRPRPKLDVILGGDVINFLELKGRGGTFVSRKHRGFYRTLAALGARGDVFWLRGNHDYVVPSGPWRRGEFYANPVLRTLVEHGDFWDKENWPPGPGNKGSRLALEAGSAFEVHASVTDKGEIKYLMSGVDNLRPWSNDAIEAFLDRRSKYSDVAAVSAVLSRTKFLGAADDSAAYKGALERRRKGKYRDWLMVQGHTHVPAYVPGVYINTGCWISTLVAPDDKERHVESFPFVLVYQGADGRRVEEYYTADQPTADAIPTATLHTEESVNELRQEYGYQKLKR